MQINKIFDALIATFGSVSLVSAFGLIFSNIFLAKKIVKKVLKLVFIIAVLLLLFSFAMPKIINLI